MSSVPRARYGLAIIAGAVAVLLTACSYATSGTGLPLAPAANPAPLSSRSAPAASSAASSDASSPASSPSSLPTAPGDAPTKAQLESIVLRDGDLPSSWTSADAGDGSGGGDTGGDTSGTPACAGLDATDKDQLDDAESSDYQQGQITVSSDATSFESAQDVTMDTKYLLGRQFLQCAKATIPSTIDAGLATGQKVSADTVTVVRGGTPANLVAILHVAVTVTVAGSSGSASEYIDTAFITGPQLEASVTFFSLGLPVPTALETQLATLVAARAALA